MEASVIYGPPGTGKSTTVIARMKDALDSGVPQDRIGLVSFTKAAAKELADRIGLVTKNIATMHSYCYRLTGTMREQVIGWQHLKEFEKVVGIPIKGNNPDEAEDLEEGDFYLALHSLAHARCISYEEAYDKSPQPGTRDAFLYFAGTYNNWKRAYGYVDFQDMLENAVDYPAPDLDILFIDEAQDLSALQWKVVRHWAGAIPRITAAGDDDQAIYIWGGADPRGLSQFETEYNAERTVLGQSYRIPAAVHALAHKIITQVRTRVDKEYRPRDERGQVRLISDPNVLDFQHGDDIMVLYRNHMMRNDVEEVLIARKIPYVVDGGKPGLLSGPVMTTIKLLRKLQDNFKHTGNALLTDKEARSMCRYLSPLAKARYDRGDYEDLDGHWARYIKGNPKQIEYLRSVEAKYGLDVQPTIHLSSIHGSKGREADRVVLINGVTNRTDSAMRERRSSFDSEMRTFYVGVTRARHQLDIVEGDNPLPVLMGHTTNFRGHPPEVYFGETDYEKLGNEEMAKLEKMHREMGEWWDPDNDCWMPSGRTEQ